MNQVYVAADHKRRYFQSVGLIVDKCHCPKNIPIGRQEK